MALDSQHSRNANKPAVLKDLSALIGAPEFCEDALQTGWPLKGNGLSGLSVVHKALEREPHWCRLSGGDALQGRPSYDVQELLAIPCAPIELLVGHDSCVFCHGYLLARRKAEFDCLQYAPEFESLK